MKKRRKPIRVPLSLVLTALLVVVAAGKTVLSRLDEDIGRLNISLRQSKLKLVEAEAQKSDLQRELAISDTDEYIAAQARKLYGYMMPGEIRFVVTNPDALYEGGDAQVEIVP